MALYKNKNLQKLIKNNKIEKKKKKKKKKERKKERKEKRRRKKEEEEKEWGLGWSNHPLSLFGVAKKIN